MSALNLASSQSLVLGAPFTASSAAGAASAAALGLRFSPYCTCRPHHLSGILCTSIQGMQRLLSLTKPAASPICKAGCHSPAACTPDLAAADCLTLSTGCASRLQHSWLPKVSQTQQACAEPIHSMEDNNARQPGLQEPFCLLRHERGERGCNEGHVHHEDNVKAQDASLQPYESREGLTLVLTSSASAASNRSEFAPCSSCVGMNLQGHNDQYEAAGSFHNNGIPSKLSAMPMGQ